MLRAVCRTLSLGLTHLVCPSTCWACGRATPDNPLSFCDGCSKAITTDPHPTCPRCSSTVGPYVDLEGGCTVCRKDDFAFDAALRMGPYQGLLRDTVLRMKRFGENLAEAMARLWAAHVAAKLKQLHIDIVVPIPLHWRRRWIRGYNQSEVLARGLARSIDVQCRPRYLRRWKATEQQTALAPTARHENVRGAFKARGHLPIEGQTVLLVDDVLTTGATASEAARALRPFRPAKIIIAVLAHGS